MTMEDVEPTTAVDSATDSPWAFVHELLQVLARSMTPEERLRRFVRTVSRHFRADAVTLLRRQDDRLVPFAAEGLAPEAMGHEFSIAEEPRFKEICASRRLVRFPAESPLADPFDGLLAGEHGFASQVHACLGLPLRLGEELAGVLALDAVAPDAFDQVPSEVFEVLSSLGVATLRIVELIEALDRAEQQQRQIATSLLEQEPRGKPEEMTGDGLAMTALREEISLFAGSEFPVLVTGETGTGKELVVQALHRHSARSGAPLVYVNCAALPEAVVESELFGHEAGAFTGANQRRLGKFQVADGGCLFLDEIGELPLSVQPKLLRALQSGEVQRVGSDRSHRVSVRVFAATNRDLDREVRAGRFRSDLMHRLDVCRIVVPPLRARTEDIPLLAGHFCGRARRQLGFGPIRLHPEALDALQAYAWPGNVRELENVLSRAVLRASGRVARGNLILVLAGDLGSEFLPDASAPRSTKASRHALADAAPSAPPRPLRAAVEDFQRRLIRDALDRNDGVWAAAARDLGMHRSNLHHLAGRLGLRD